jgi:hypothetical protein
MTPAVVVLAQRHHVFGLLEGFRFGAAEFPRRGRVGFGALSARGRPSYR